MGKSSQVAQRIAPATRNEGASSVCKIPSWLVGPAGWKNRQSGALVIGGDYRALGTVRSLGRQGVPVWVLTDDHLIAGVSRFAQRSMGWPKGDSRKQVHYLLELSKRHDLLGWSLFPSSDETAALIARHHDLLRTSFRLTVPPWKVLQWGYDKRLTHRLASTLGIPIPWTHIPTGREDVVRLDCRFPVILKPAAKPQHNALTAAKAWRFENREELLAGYDEACRLVDPDTIMIQELIPGPGEEQFSYATLCVDGRSLASLVARRTRQYPVDFGRSSTFVETIDRREIENAGQQLVHAMSYTGVVELEFKRDPQSGQYKLLDINPRIWGWHTLGQRAEAVDFSLLLWRLTQGESFNVLSGRSGVSWMRLSTDVPAALTEIWRGRLSAMEYLKSFRGSVESAIFASDDPLPALLEMPLGAYAMLKRLCA